MEDINDLILPSKITFREVKSCKELAHKCWTSLQRSWSKRMVAIRIGKHQSYPDSEEYCALHNEEGWGARWSWILSLAHDYHTITKSRCFAHQTYVTIKCDEVPDEWPSNVEIIQSQRGQPVLPVNSWTCSTIPPPIRSPCVSTTPTLSPVPSLHSKEWKSEY